MDDTDASQVAADMHRLSNQIENLTAEADMLAAENVETSTANSLLNTQEAIQQQIQQLISNLIQLQSESGSVQGETEEHDLALNGSVPFPQGTETDLPSPRIGEPSKTEETPSWVGGEQPTTTDSSGGSP